MNSLGLKKVIDEFLNKTHELNVFLSHLRELSSYYDGINTYLSVIAKGVSDERNNSATKIVNHLNSIGNVIEKISQRQFFKELEEFQKALNFLREIWPADEEEIFKNNIYKLNNFASDYDAYLGKRNGLSAYLLLLNASRVNSSIINFLEALNAVSGALYDEIIIPDGDSKISVLMPEHYGLKDFAQRLLAIQSIYTELCLLFNISENDFPLTIGKVESGSLWAVLFGNTKIIELISSFIKEAASFAYRNYTKEGKLSALPKKVEAIDALLNLTQRLEAEGFNTAEMKPNIEKAAVAVARDLTTLVDGQPSITVNDEKLSLKHELTKALLERRDVRLLERNPEQKPDEEPPALPE